jgi:uncharacterized protein YcgI (DUF1989 family)
VVWEGRCREAPPYPDFIKALGELGMGPRDIAANINLFMNVR